MRYALEVIGTVTLWAWRKLRRDRLDRWEQYQRDHPEKFPTKFYPDGTPYA